jgi:hypothetical protein
MSVAVVWNVIRLWNAYQVYMHLQTTQAMGQETGWWGYLDTPVQCVTMMAAGMASGWILSPQNTNAYKATLWSRAARTGIGILAAFAASQLLTIKYPVPNEMLHIRQLVFSISSALMKIKCSGTLKYTQELLEQYGMLKKSMQELSKDALDILRKDAPLVRLGSVLDGVPLDLTQNAALGSYAVDPSPTPVQPPPSTVLEVTAADIRRHRPLIQSVIKEWIEMYGDTVAPL